MEDNKFENTFSKLIDGLGLFYRGWFLTFPYLALLQPGNGHSLGLLCPYLTHTVDILSHTTGQLAIFSVLYPHIWHNPSRTLTMNIDFPVIWFDSEAEHCLNQNSLFPKASSHVFWRPWIAVSLSRTPYNETLLAHVMPAFQRVWSPGIPHIWTMLPKEEYERQANKERRASEGLPCKSP